MAQKTTRRRPRRRSSAPVSRPASGRSPRAPRRPPPQGAVTGGPDVAPALSDESLGETYSHVKRDLRRILVLGVLMFALIYGAKLMADVYGSSFVLDLVR